MKISDIVKEYRKVNKISMDTLATRSGLSKAYIGILENDFNPTSKKPVKPSLETLKKLATGMNMSLDELISIMDSDEEISLKDDSSEDVITVPSFKTAQDAIRFILEVPMVADFGGYDLDRMTDEQLINFATEVAGMIQVMSRHYPSKDE